MNSFMKVFKSATKFKQSLMAVLAGALLLFSTACSNPKVISNSQPDPNTGSYYQKSGQQTELYAPVQERKGGMNMYEDVDPHANTKGTQKMAKKLVENSQDNLKNRMESPQDYVDNYRSGAPLNKRIENLTDNIGSSVEQVKDDFSGGVDRGLRNAKSNASKVPDNAGSVVKEATEGAKNRLESGVKTTQRTTDVIKDNLEDSAEILGNRAENATLNTKRSLNNSMSR